MAMGKTIIFVIIDEPSHSKSPLFRDALGTAQAHRNYLLACFTRIYTEFCFIWS